MPADQTLVEAGTVTLAEASESGIANVTLITPGQGSSGEYSADVLEAAATEGVFAAGTHMYIDHPTPGERPERSLARLAGVLLEDATWDGEGLKAPARIYPRWRSMLKEMESDIGVSIRAGGVVESGVVRKIGPVASVDFVTKPGRGGSFQLVESAVVVEAHGMTANELSDALSTAVREKHGGQDIYTWVRDYADDFVIFSVETPDSSGIYRDTYTVSGTTVALSGEPVEVTARTDYVPVTESTPIHDELIGSSPERPAPVAGQPASDPLPVPTEESVEDPMPDLTEAEVQALRESAQQLPTVTAERDAARAELAARDRRDAARPIINEALAAAAIPPSARLRLTESLATDAPARDDGALDEDALRTAIESARTAAEAEAAEVLAANGVGQVRGLGAGASATSTTESLGDADLDALYESIYPKGA